MLDQDTSLAAPKVASVQFKKTVELDQDTRLAAPRVASVQFKKTVEFDQDTRLVGVAQGRFVTVREDG